MIDTNAARRTPGCRRSRGFRGSWPRHASKLAITLILAAYLVLASTPLTAQLSPPPPEMEQLTFLVGEWKGTGWIEYSPGQRGEFRGTEHVEQRMGNRLVVVEGSFTAATGPDGPEVPVHQAFGIFSYDAADTAFVLRTYTAHGADGDAHPVEIGRDRLVWGYEDPRQGLVRYTIEVTPEGKWHETGRASRDGGETWHDFFEMTLSRK